MRSLINQITRNLSQSSKYYSASISTYDPTNNSAAQCSPPARYNTQPNRAHQSPYPRPKPSSEVRTSNSSRHLAALHIPGLSALLLPPRRTRLLNRQPRRPHVQGHAHIAAFAQKTRGAGNLVDPLRIAVDGLAMQVALGGNAEHFLDRLVVSQ